MEASKNFKKPTTVKLVILVLLFLFNTIYVLAQNQENDDSTNVDEVSSNFGVSGTTVISHSTFESGLDGWTSGGGDAYRHHSSTRVNTGSYGIVIRDDDASGSTTSFMSPMMDISAYDKIDTTTFSTGTYIVKVQSKTGSISQKIIVN